MKILTHLNSSNFAGSSVADVPLSEIDLPEGRAPRGLVKSIKNQGLIEPVVLTFPNPDVGDQFCHVIAGRRRLMALRELNAESVVAIMQAGTLSQNAGQTLVENLQRSRNLLSELQAYRDLLREGKSSEEIQKWLGLFKRDVKLLQTLANMAPITEVMLHQGRIAPSTAKVLAKLSKEDQQAFFEQPGTDETSKFTLESVHAWRKSCLFPRQQLSFLASIPNQL